MDFDFKGNLVLEDESVLLRPLQWSDADQLLYLSEQEPELWKYSLVGAGGGRRQLEHYIGIAVEAREKKTGFPFVVIDKKSGRYAGSTRFCDMNFAHRSLQLGYTWYGRDFQGTGLNKHCKFLLLRYAFEALGVERVEFRADAENIKSIAAMKSIGCTVEGILRSHQPKPEGGRRDSIVLSILKDEWPSVKQKLMQRL